jgi:hypothetical protein
VATKTQSEPIKAAISYSLFGHKRKGAIWYYSLIRYIHEHIPYIFKVSRKRKLNDDSCLYYEYVLVHS